MRRRIRQRLGLGSSAVGRQQRSWEHDHGRVPADGPRREERLHPSPSRWSVGCSSSSVPACDADREIGKRLRLNELHDTASWVDSAPVVLQPRTRVHRVVGQPRHAHVRARLERVRRRATFDGRRERGGRPPCCHRRDPLVVAVREITLEERLEFDGAAPDVP